MEIITLYHFRRESGGITESPNKPDGVDYTTRCRLIADEGKILTNGNVETYCIDVDSADGWSEIDDPQVQTETEGYDNDR